MFKRIDQSPTLARFLKYISGTLAQKRGLLTLIGILLIIISLIVQAIDVFVGSQALELIGVILIHLGLIVGLLGLLLSDALGN
jgi:hypothetical protein